MRGFHEDPRVSDRVFSLCKGVVHDMLFFVKGKTSWLAVWQL